MERIPSLQGLRAFAVVLVIVYHAWPDTLPGGYIGVDVFFVLSGFLITTLLTNELARTGRIDLLEFYARRTRRLTPALVTVIVAVLVVASLWYAPVEQKMLTSSAVASLTYLSNVWFAHSSTDYLGEAHTDQLLHTWSLSVEEQFYIVWPALIWGLWRFKRIRMPVSLSLVAIISFAVCLTLMRSSPPWAFFMMPPRAWEFATGALVALTGSPSKSVTHAGWPQICALLGIVATAAIFDSSTTHPGPLTLVPVLATCVLLKGVTRDTFVTRILSTRVAQYLGDRSYSLYLWHWPVLVAARELVHAQSTGALFGAMLLALVLSELTFRLVEQPARHSTSLVRRPRRGLLFMGGAIAFCLAIAYGVRSHAASRVTDASQERYARALLDSPATYRGGCHADFFDVAPVPCPSGADVNSADIVVMGDSHAGHWLPAFERLSSDTGIRVISYTKSGCPAAAFEPFDRKLRRRYTECTQWRDAVIDAIGHLRPRLLVVSTASSYISKGDADEEAWTNGVRVMLERVRPFVNEVVILGDTPNTGFHSIKCLARAAERRASPGKACSFEFDEELSDRLSSKMWGAAQGTGVRVVSTARWVCPTRTCTTQRDGLIVYRDDSHLTASFSATLAPLMGDALGLFARADRGVLDAPDGKPGVRRLAP